MSRRWNTLKRLTQLSVPSIVAEGRRDACFGCLFADKLLISVAKIDLNNLVGTVVSTGQIHVVDPIPAIHQQHVKVTVNRELPECSKGVFTFDGLEGSVWVEIALFIDGNPAKISPLSVNILLRQVVPY